MKVQQTGWECSSCRVGEFWQWDDESDVCKRGGRWCPNCGYGVHPPEPVKAV
jgi:hypothetical protein